MHPLSLLATVRGRLRALFRRDAVERRFTDEIRFHLEMETEQNVRRGMSPEDARRAAAIAFGGVERMREDHRDARGARLVEDAIADLRYAARWLARSRGFTTSAVMTLGLGIGGTTAVFCVVDGVLLKPLPYPRAEQLVAVWSVTRGNIEPWASSPPDFRELRARARAFDQIAAYYSTATNVAIDGEPVRVPAVRASAGIFPLLGVTPLMGRVFRADEEVAGNDRVAVLSHAAWVNRFGGRPSIIGSALMLDERPHTVVGVLPPSFRFVDRTAEVWVPLAFADDDVLNTRGNYFLNILGRMRPGMTIDGARADLGRVAAQVAEEYPQGSLNGVQVVPLHEQTVGDARAALTLLLTATVVLLAIACANVAGLLLARSAGRQRELAVRAGLGATRGRLVRQLVTEGLLLGAAGATAGVALAAFALHALRRVGPTDVPRLDEVAMDARVLAVAVGTSVLAALAFGLWPALRLTRGEQHEVLRAGTGSSTSAGHHRVRRVLVAAQVGLALLLLVGSGLLVRSFAAMTRVDPGFRPTNVITASLPIRTARYADATRTWAFADALLARVTAIPQVETAALTSALSLRGGGWGKRITLADRALPTSMDQVPTVGFRLVSLDYFRTLGVRRVAGRTFQATDRPGSVEVVVVNETLAKRFFPAGDAVGKRLWLGPPESMVASLLPAGFRFPRLTIVGVVADERFAALDEPPQPEIYAPYGQSTETPSAFYLAVRSPREPTALVAELRAALRDVDAAMPLAEVATARELMRESGARRRFGTLLVTSFAVLALGLAVVGVYGVVAQFVTQRSRELSIRMALGAGSDRVVGLVVREGLMTAIAGAVLGLGAALAVARVMRDVLFGVTTTDPVTFVVIPVVLTLAVVLASAVPALRATRIPPAGALRGD